MWVHGFLLWAVFFFPVTLSGVPVTSVQNPGKMGRNARDNLTAKNARDNFCNARDKNGKFLPVTKKNARDKIQKLCPWQKKIARDILGTNFFFPRLRRGPFFYWDFVRIIFLPVTIFENARDISSKVVSCPWHVPVTFLKKIARDISRMPVTLVKKSARDMPKCPWQFSKSGNVTGKKVSRGKKKNTGPV